MLKNKKLKKFLKRPGLFFRDYFVKKYPIINSELGISEDHEYAINFSLLNTEKLENSLGYSCDVDVVYTWVNDKDLNWENKKNIFLKIENNLNKLACDKARFEDHNELYYSIMSVRGNLPWVRNIYIITDDQIPSWYKNQENIYIIDHADIIDKKFLPTFNSHVIEAHLHKIPNLSENFIYFNDDVFVAKPIDKSHFFKSNGLVSIFVSNKKISNMWKGENKTPTLYATNNSIESLRKVSDIKIDNSLIHTYVPLKKSTYLAVWEKYNKEIEKFIINKFRSNNDLNLATFLVPWYSYIEGQAVITNDICYYFNIRSVHAKVQYEKLLTKKIVNNLPHSICLNDFKVENNHFHDFEVYLNKFLNGFFKDI